MNGLTDLGETAGQVTRDDTCAARWSLDGRSTTLLGEAGTSVTAVGPNGPWAVLTYTSANPLLGESELVTRDNGRTPLRGTPDLGSGNRRSADSVGGPDAAIVWVGDGIGQGRIYRPVLWKAGTTLSFPVSGTYFLGPACTSQLQADGSTVYSGSMRANGEIAFVLVRHVGGVPGTDVTLTRATAADQPRGGLHCAPASSADTLAQHEDGVSRLSLWDAGVRTRLSTPRGWNVTEVIEFTEAGLLVANARNAAGVVRPIAWRLTGEA